MTMREALKSLVGYGVASHLHRESTKTCNQGFENFGLNVDKKNNITYREWAPAAYKASIIGEFSESSLFGRIASNDPYLHCG